MAALHLHPLTPTPSRLQILQRSGSLFSSVFCCVLVKSQLATVSRSLAALTMASGIMLNAAPRLLSPIDRHQRRPSEHTGKGRQTLNEDVTAITQARLTDAPLCLLFLLSCARPAAPPHRPLSCSALFFFSSKNSFSTVFLKCSFISRSSFIMHGHFEFA